MEAHSKCQSIGNQQYSLSTEWEITYRDTTNHNKHSPAACTQFISMHCLKWHAMLRSCHLFWDVDGVQQEMAGKQGWVVALNELLGAFPSVQVWVPLTWHPECLLRGTPFIKQSYTSNYHLPVSLSVFLYYILSVMPSVSLCPSVILVSLTPITRTPLLTISSLHPHHHFFQYSDWQWWLSMGSRSRVWHV